MATAARRGHGEGSVYRDAANGTWVGAISLGWRPDGSRIRHALHDVSSAQAQSRDSLHQACPLQFGEYVVNRVRRVPPGVGDLAHAGVDDPRVDVDLVALCG
jgi:hypothetical protein